MKIRIGIALFAALAMTGAVAAADAPAKAATCGGCHGAAGVAPNPMWPNLAGQNAMYLVKAMKDFRDGNRSDPMMAPMAAGLSDADIQALAEYYASL